jgi:hypothetical protein
MRWNDLGRVLLAHPAGRQALHTDPDLLADAARGWRGAEPAGETEVVPFCPVSTTSPSFHWSMLAPVTDARAPVAARPASSPRCVPSLCQRSTDLVVGRARSVRALGLGVAAGFA